MTIIDSKNGLFNYIDGYFDMELNNVLSSDVDKSNIKELKDKYLVCFYLMSPWDLKKNDAIVPSDYYYTKKAIDFLYK